MAKDYRRGRATRAIDWWFERLTRLGLGASYRRILTVPRRRTGRLHSTPVDVIELNGHRWLVAGYGLASWVLNARAGGEVKLSRGGRTERYTIIEAGAEDAVPVLRKYIDEIRVTRACFDATPSSTDAAVAAELSRHPVFRLTQFSEPRAHPLREDVRECALPALPAFGRSPSPDVRVIPDSPAPAAAGVLIAMTSTRRGSR